MLKTWAERTKEDHGLPKMEAFNLDLKVSRTLPGYMMEGSIRGEDLTQKLVRNGYEAVEGPLRSLGCWRDG